MRISLNHHLSLPEPLLALSAVRVELHALLEGLSSSDVRARAPTIHGGGEGVEVQEGAVEGNDGAAESNGAVEELV